MYQQNKLLHKFKQLANIALDQYLSRKKPEVSNLQHISCKVQKLPDVFFLSSLRNALLIYGVNFFSSELI